MVTRRELLARQQLQIIDLEHRQYKVLHDNLKAARAELKAVLERDPTNVYNARFANQLDDILKPFENSTIMAGTVYQEGSEMGVEILKNQTNLLTTPFVNYGVVAAYESQGTNLIVQASDDLKKAILRQVQINQASGGQLQSLMQNILGTGLQGVQARDGSFRTARWRAEAIARTTVNDLVNTAALATYQKADLENPLVRIGKEWVTTSDSRTSDICRNLSGQRRPLDQPFSGGYQHPPAHPFCRSRVVAYTMDSRE